ncbi:hypothetical protein [Pedobacter sp. WC2423]|uniref:hypothetical protein n=1 Tax=Pedobacter sp. WC2423 TaxID=3234142 RepID=UPI0034673E9C
MKSLKIILMAMVISFFNVSCEPSPSPASMVLGSFFSGLTNHLNSIIQQAQSSGTILELTAASQLMNVIEQARIAYDGQLDHTLDSFTAAERQTFLDINRTIIQLDKGVTNSIINTQNLMLTLPLMDRVPQIRLCTGNIIAPNQKKYTLHLAGGFWDLAKDGYRAVLKINGKVIKPIIKATNEVEFQMPKALFKTPANEIVFIPCEIEIDYKKDKLLVFSSKETAKFSQKLIVLPLKFAQVSLETSSLQDSTFVRVNQTCGPYIWSSIDGNNHNEIQGCDMEAGWQCDIASVHPVLLGAQGRSNVDWFDNGNQSSLGGAKWKMLTTPKSGPFGHDGVVSINLIYNSFQIKKVDVVKLSKPVDLGWGTTTVFDLPRNSIWKLVFKKYDNSVFTIASTDQSSSLVKLNLIKDRQILIATAPFNGL